MLQLTQPTAAAAAAATAASDPPVKYCLWRKGTQFTYDIPDGLIPGDCVEIKGVLTGHKVVLELVSHKRAAVSAQLPLRVGINRGGHFELLSQSGDGRNDRVKTGKFRGEFRTNSSFTVQILVETDHYEVRLNDEALGSIEHESLHNTIQMLRLDGEAEFNSVEFLDIDDLDSSIASDLTDVAINPTMAEPLDIDTAGDIATTPKIGLPSAQVELNFPYPEVDVSVMASAEAELDVDTPEQVGIEVQVAGEVFDQKAFDSVEPELTELDIQLSRQTLVGAEMPGLPEPDIQMPDAELDVEVSGQSELEVDVPREVDLGANLPEELGIDAEISGQANIEVEVPEHIDIDVEVSGQVDADSKVPGQVDLDAEFSGQSHLELPEQEEELDHKDGASESSSNVSLSGEVDANAQHADVNLDDLALENATQSDQDEPQSTAPQDLVDAGPQVDEDFGQEGVEEEVLFQQATASLHSKPPTSTGPTEPDKEAEVTRQIEPEPKEKVELRPRRPGLLRNDRDSQKQLKQQQKQKQKEEKALQKQQKQQRKQEQKEQKAMIKQQQRSGKKARGSGGSFWSFFRRSKSYSLERAAAASDSSDHNDVASTSGTYRPTSWLSETEPPSPTLSVTPRFHSLPRLPTSAAAPAAAAAAASALVSASPQQRQRRGEFILAAPPDPDEGDQLDTESLASDRRLREPELASFRRSVQENLLTQRSSCEPHGGQSSFFRARSANSTSSSSGSSSEGSLAADSTVEVAAVGLAPRLVTLR